MIVYLIYRLTQLNILKQVFVENTLVLCCILSKRAEFCRNDAAKQANYGFMTVIFKSLPRKTGSDFCRMSGSSLRQGPHRRALSRLSNLFPVSDFSGISSPNVRHCDVKYRLVFHRHDQRVIFHAPRQPS